METNIQFDELQELRAQLTLLNHKLDKQKIINAQLIKNSIKKKILSIKSKSLVATFFMLLIATPLYLFFYFHLNISLTIVIPALLIVYFGAIYEIWSLIEIKSNMINEDLTNSKEKILRAKKRKKNWIYFSIPLVPIFITCLDLGGFPLSHFFEPSFIIKFIIFATIAYFLQRRDYKAMDEIIKQIEELRKEE
jgi:hypothetical protein